VMVGTYSSIFVASPILLIWEGKFGKRAQKKT
jgi:preprotein translocase subunit SecF